MSKYRVIIVGLTFCLSSLANATIYISCPEASVIQIYKDSLMDEKRMCWKINNYRCAENKTCSTALCEGGQATSATGMAISAYTKPVYNPKTERYDMSEIRCHYLSNYSVPTAVSGGEISMIIEGKCTQTNPQSFSCLPNRK